MDMDPLAVIRDLLVLAYMFVLRIGVPILITLMIGAWLRRLIEKEDQPQTTEQPAAARHCWETSTSADAQEAKAIAQARPDLPCWLALQVGGAGLKEMCYGCPLYSPHASAVVRVR